ncbi:MAG: AMP-binding protein, partial [Myxococcota bacterium]
MRKTAETLTAAVRQLRKDPNRGFRFLGLDRQERYFSYEALEAEALRRAARLQALGIERGDRIAMVLPEPHEFVLSFLGAAFAGAVPVPIFPQASFRKTEAYLDSLQHIVETSGARWLVCMQRNLELVSKLKQRELRQVRFLIAPDDLNPTPEDLIGFKEPELTPDDLCFLQFTSGSTSKPKGVMVTHRNVITNARSFLGPDGLNRSDDDIGVSWLPLFHDMGLIGFVLGTLVCDIPVVLFPTELFGRSPRMWLELISKHRATITYAPNFAYQLVTKRLRDRDIAQLDLSSLRVAGCGAEPIRASTLRDFAARLEPAGFRQTAFLPSYGMAESTLAISFHDVAKAITVDNVDAEAMQRGQALPAEPGRPALELVSCGVPFPGH